MKLKNFHKVVAETPDDVKNKVTTYLDRIDLEERIKTNGYCCIECGRGYLTEAQKMRKEECQRSIKGFVQFARKKKV